MIRNPKNSKVYPRHPVIPPEVNGVLGMFFGVHSYLLRRLPWMSRVYRDLAFFPGVVK